MADPIEMLLSTMDWSQCEEKEMNENFFKLVETVQSDNESSEDIQ